VSALSIRSINFGLIKPNGILFCSGMYDLIQKYNLIILKWLNNSYDNRKANSNFFWCIQPAVFFRLNLRVFFIISKKVLKIFFAKSKTLSGNEANTYNREGGKKTLLNILLYRENNVIHNKFFYTPSERLNVDQIRKLAFTFSKVQKPLVSIVIPVYNKLEYTVNCLLSLQKNISNKITYEIIIVNDNSKDETSEIFGKVEGIKLINNAENIGFILSCMKGADQSTGHYICFLNNDTEVLAGWLETLVGTFKEYPKAGLVGSMLIYPNNQLQEAGGVIWSDATGWNYGRLKNFIDPKYNFVRPVDYCSGASIIISKEDFYNAGGFEKDFVPAYYEDTDLCFSVRHKLNKQVLYQPESKLLHHEGISAGTSTSSGMKRFQNINAEKFRVKWQKELQTHFASGSKNAAQAPTRFCGEKTIIIVDTGVPLFDKDSGSYRMYHIIKILKQLNYHVIFVPDNDEPTQPYTQKFQQMGVEVLYYTSDFKVSLINQIRELLNSIDIAWVCRPDHASKYFPVFRSNPKIKIVYDTIDLHYMRLKREIELYPERGRTSDWQKVQRLELAMAKSADKVLAITNTDKEILENQGVINLETIPNIHVPYKKEKPPFEERKGILFIGSYHHKPNVDAVVWLCSEIMPLVWEKHPDIVVTLLGNNPGENILNLAGPNIVIPGFIEDVSSYFLNNKIFVAPLNYGSGMKGKIGQSLEYSLPLISTSVGVEGMNLLTNYNCIIAEDTQSFAREIVRLYYDKTLWESISSKCHEAIHQYSPEYVRERISGILHSLTKN
jgi:GT2 family glycosyltransferase